MLRLKSKRPVVGHQKGRKRNDAMLKRLTSLRKTSFRCAYFLIRYSFARGRILTTLLLSSAFTLLPLSIARIPTGRSCFFRRAPLIERKRVLEMLMKEAKPSRIRYSEHIEGDSAAIYRNACRLQLEGIVSKRKNSPYRSGRLGAWEKVKCTRRGALRQGTTLLLEKK